MLPRRKHTMLPRRKHKCYPEESINVTQKKAYNVTQKKAYNVTRRKHTMLPRRKHKCYLEESINVTQKKAYNVTQKKAQMLPRRKHTMLPRRKHTTFRTGIKFEIKNTISVITKHLKKLNLDVTAPTKPLPSLLRRRRESKPGFQLICRQSYLIYNITLFNTNTNIYVTNKLCTAGLFQLLL